MTSSRAVALLAAVLFLFYSNSYAQRTIGTQGLMLDDGSMNGTIHFSSPTTILSSYSIKLPSSQGAAGYTFVNDGAGNLSWQPAASGLFWTTTGNVLTGATPQTPAQYFGSVNNYDVVFYSNNTEKMRIGAAGHLLPAANQDLGSIASPWRTVYATDAYYLDGNPWLYDGPGGLMGNTFVGNTQNTVNTGTLNTFVGMSSGSANTSGVANTFSGFNSGKSNTSGNSNAFYGTSAGLFNTTGNNNAFLGAGAGISNTTGLNNTFVGSFTAPLNTTGTNNTCVGDNANFVNPSGNGNTDVGESAGFNNNGASGTTFIGTESGVTNTTGSNNTLLGAGSDLNTGNLSNATAIGANAIVSSSNALVLGSINGLNGATADVNVGIGVAAPQTRLDIRGDIALRQTTLPALAAGNNNNLAIGNFSYIRISSNAGGSTITGISGGVDGKIVIILNTANNLTIADLNGASAAANQIQTLSGANLTTVGPGMITLIYDATVSNWIVMAFQP